jgi:hypothetical protein
MLSRLQLIGGATLLGLVLGIGGCGGSSSREAKIPTQTFALPDKDPVAAGGDGKKGPSKVSAKAGVKDRD